VDREQRKPGGHTVSKRIGAAILGTAHAHTVGPLNATGQSTNYE